MLFTSLFFFFFNFMAHRCIIGLFRFGNYCFFIIRNIQLYQFNLVHLYSQEHLDQKMYSACTYISELLTWLCNHYITVHLSSLRSTIRALNKNFSIAFFFPAFITLLFFQHNRTVYDIVAGTIVVKRNRHGWCVWIRTTCWENNSTSWRTEPKSCWVTGKGEKEEVLQAEKC